MTPTFDWSALTTSGFRKTRNDDSFLIFSAGIEGAIELSAESSSPLSNEDLIFGVGFDWDKIAADIAYSALNNVSDNAIRFTLSITGF